MTRRTAACLGLVAWLLALLAAPEYTPRALAVWGLIAGAVIATSIVVSRVLTRELKHAVLKDRS